MTPRNNSAAAILPAEEWCPIFVYYKGTSAPKYNDQQIEQLCRQGAERNWCNLCDAPMHESVERHWSKHAKQLREWRKTRGAIVDRERAERLALARKERKAVADALAVSESPISKPRTRGRR